MNSRERLLTALRHQEPDRIPIDLGGLPTGIEALAYDALKEILGFKGETKTFVRDHVEIDEAILVRFGIDTRYIRVGPPSNFELRIERDNSYVDFWGTRWKKPASSFYWDMVDYPIKESTIDAIKRYQWPDPDDPGRFAGVRERAKALYDTTEYALVLDMLGLGVFEQTWALRGFENFLLDLAMNPDFAEALLQRMADYYIALYGHILDEIGDYVQVVMTSDDLGVQTGPMISLETYQSLIKPAEKRVWQFIKSRTNAYVFFHSCGSVRRFIPDLIEAGIDILNPIQVSAEGMDPKELKSEFGNDLTFWGGGCDTQKVLPFGTPDDVEREVRRRISELAPGGGFVFNQIHNIQPQVPPENIVRMLETALRYGAYPSAL
jgi:uroporphyrinogen decarboxylase